MFSTNKNKRKVNQTKETHRDRKIMKTFFKIVVLGGEGGRKGGKEVELQSFVVIKLCLSGEFL